MIVMQGNFDLNEGVSFDEFTGAYRAYAGHLKEQGYVDSWVCMQREPHDGYNLNAPEQAGLVQMIFTDLETSNKCWDYVESDEEPVRVHHSRIKASVHNISFSLQRATATSG